jgi:hypothetical protein
MEPQDRTVEERIAWIATAANGIVTAAELDAAAISRSERRRRVEKGLLIPQFRGVYRVGHRAPSPHATYTAAVKACGPGAALAGFAAAWLLGLIRGDAPAPEVLTRTPRAVPGVLTRCCRRLGPSDVAKVDQIRVTTVPRTIVDLAPRMSDADLARLFHEARVKYRIKPERVERGLAGRTAAKRLRAVMYGDTPVLLSRAEQRMFAMIDAAGLPRPAANERVGNRYLDLRWPGLTVEIDSYRYHGSRHAWGNDHARRRDARKRRDEFVAFTSDEVFQQGEMVVAELRAALEALPTSQAKRPPLDAGQLIATSRLERRRA